VVTFQLEGKQSVSCVSGSGFELKLCGLHSCLGDVLITYIIGLFWKNRRHAVATLMR
jgi:hypothetical protein